MHDDDRWLERWLPLLAERAMGRPVLELGCGTGRDTAVLLKAGHSVIAIDRSLASITIARVAARGVLICRLNSTRDHHFGASGHRPIEQNFFDVDGEPKRFFDRAAIERLFGRGWTLTHLEESVIDRYHAPKAVWLLQGEAATSASP